MQDFNLILCNNREMCNSQNVLNKIVSQVKDPIKQSANFMKFG